jgi:serine/threonine protein kinase
MKEVLEAGSVLLLNGYVHGDLHEQNILLDKGFHPRIIDFGRAFSVKRLSQQTIDESWTQYDASFAPESPEMALAIAAVSDVPFGQAIEDMRNEKAGILNAERILGVPRAHQIQELVEFWRGSKSAQAQDWLKFWRLYWPVMDSWSFGTMLLSMYKRLLLSKSFTDSEEWTNKHHIVETVLRGLLHSSPRKRFDCVEALAVYDPLNGLVTRGAGKKWLTALRKQTRN